MLVEVVDEEPAQDPNEGHHHGLEEDLLEHLGEHYAQPIHIPSVRFRSTRYYFEEGSSLAVPPVVRYCNEQLLLPQQHGGSGDDINTATTDVASRPRRRHRHRRHRSQQQTMVRNLLSLYPTKIRQYLFSPERTVQTTGVAVLYHYDWLLSLLCHHHIGDDDDDDDDDDSSHDDNVDEDDDDDDDVLMNGHHNGRDGDNNTLSKKKDRLNTTRHHEERLEGTLQRLMSDLTICVGAAVHAVSSTHEMDEKDGKAITATTKENNLGDLLRHYVIPTMFRLCHKLLYRQTNFFDVTISCRCVTRLLAWAQLRVGPTLVAPGLLHALSVRGVIEVDDCEEETPQSSTRPINHNGNNNNNTLPKIWQGLDWNHAVELMSDEWNTPVAQQQAAMCWKCWNDEDEDMRTCQKATCERLGWNAMATAVRQYFFGKDDAMMMMMEDDETAIVRTRLHLGRTVPEEPVEYEKPYRAIPSRMHAACVFISLLDHLTINASVLQDLVPILYELLAAPQESVQAMGACCLYQLLQISRGQQYVWSPVVLSNLAAALDLAVQTCRKGPVVTLLGVSQVALLRRLASQDALQQRRKASQQWLMILNKNLYNVELVWGIMSGALVRLAADHAHGDDNEGLELGRLVLSCLLPLIRQDEGAATATTGTLADEIQWLALVTLTRWVVAAHAVMVRHEGKLIGSLLLCLGRTVDDASPVFVWAKHAAAMVVVAVSSRHTDDGQASPVRSAKLDQIIDAGVYQERLVLVAKQVSHDAQILANRMKQRDG